MPIAPEEQAFLQRIQARPDDDGPRLILADWLDERGDPRGEFIRLQCALARLPAEDPRHQPLADRERALRDAYEAEWIRPLGGLVVSCEYRRGLVEIVSLEEARFLEVAPELFRLAPVRRVRLLEAGPRFADLIRSPLLARVRELDLCSNYLGNGGANLLSRCEHLARLAVLDLGFNNVSDRGVRALVDSPNLRGLRALRLNDNNLAGAAAARALAASPYLTNLRALDLSGNEISGAGMSALADGEALRQLRSLGIHANRIADAGAEALARSPLLTRMLEAQPALDLRRNGIGPVGARALADSPRLANLEVLKLGGNPIGNAGLQALAAARHLRRLRELDLGDCRVGDPGVRALARSHLLATLTRVSLLENVLRSETVAALEEASFAVDWRRPALDLVVDPTLVLLSRRRQRRLPPGARPT